MTLRELKNKYSILYDTPIPLLIISKKVWSPLYLKIPMNLNVLIVYLEMHNYTPRSWWHNYTIKEQTINIKDNKMYININRWIMQPESPLSSVTATFFYRWYNKLQQFCICFETYKSSAYCTQRLDMFTVISFFSLKGGGGVTAF